MKLTLKAVRLYGSKSHYGTEPHLMPKDGYFELPKYPSESENSFVFLGKPVEEFFEAKRNRFAIGCAMLSRKKGENDLPLSFDESVNAYLLEQKKDKYRTGDYNWYITLCIERHIEVDNSYLHDNEFLWLNYANNKIKKLKNDYSAYTKPFLDSLATYTSTIVEPGFFNKVILDEIFFFSSGKLPIGLPEFKGGGTGYCTNIPFESLDIEKLHKMFDKLCNLSTQLREWILTPMHWYLESLKESDIWKQFLWSFWSLEILCLKYIDNYHGNLIKASDVPEEIQVKLKEIEINLDDLIEEERFLPLNAKFAIMALDIAPDTAKEDIKIFKNLNAIRSKLSHGGIKDVNLLPIGEFQGLLKKCIAKAIYSFHGFKENS